MIMGVVFVGIGVALVAGLISAMIDELKKRQRAIMTRAEFIEARGFLQAIPLRTHTYAGGQYWRGVSLKRKLFMPTSIFQKQRE